MKVKECIVLSEIHLRTTGRHSSMGSHSVICHPTEVAFIPTGQVGTRFIDPVRMKGWAFPFSVYYVIMRCMFIIIGCQLWWIFLSGSLPSLYYFKVITTLYLLLANKISDLIWVGLVGWLRTKMVCPPTDGQPTRKNCSYLCATHYCQTETVFIYIPLPPEQHHISDVANWS